MKLITLFFVSILLSTTIYSQEFRDAPIKIPAQQKYNFTPVIDIEASVIKNQGNTGTCWSFSASSFIESEIYKNTGQLIDISEMYNVRETYNAKAWNYVMRQGKTQFSEGGLAHDVLNSIKLNGLVPESAFTGLIAKSTSYDHSKIVPEIQVILDNYIKNDKNSNYANWKTAVDSILNITIGKKPENFSYNGLSYNSKSFLEMTKFNPANYVTLTSFLNEPFNSQFVLNIPDNFSNELFYNVTLNELVEVADNALKNGYTLSLDCDVSEKTFSSKYGIAIIPKKLEEQEKCLTYIVEESYISPEFRQQEFENYNTTDDHLMHIVGLVKDQNNNEYYKVKNSWGTNSERIGNDGYVYMSKSFFMLKTISIMVNKKALNNDLKKELQIQ